MRGRAPLRPAAFLDRDGTLVVEVNYLARPEQVRLLPGATAAVRRLNDAGVAVVVVTNQSGIARGMFTEAEYDVIERLVVSLLAEEGARVDATYHCPHHPEITGPCACRKPGTLLYERAAADLGLDPARSLFAGDRWRDVAPALRLGGTGVLVPAPHTPPEELALARRDARVVATLGEAVDGYLAGLRGAPSAADRAAP